MRCMVVTAACLLLALTVSAQDVVSVIETDAEATIDSVPTYVEFTLSKTLSAASLAEAVTEAMQFEPKLREQIDEQALSTKQLSFSSVIIPTANSRDVSVQARLRFSTVAFTANTDGLLEFARLCDKVSEMAKTAGATLEGPEFGVDTPAAVEQAAVGRAIEMAYPNAEAAAAIMRGQILAVDRVTILSVTWGKAAEQASTQSDVRRVACTAKVRVTYAFGPTTP